MSWDSKNKHTTSMGKTNTLDTTLPLLPNKFYHLINRGNNKQNIFYQHRNYAYFLSKYAEYMTPYLDTYAYCLLPNHFHLLVAVKDVKSILTAAPDDCPLINEQTWLLWKLEIDNLDFSGKKKVPLTTILQKDLSIEKQTKIASWVVMEKARRWLMGYAKAINKQENLEGSLFRKKIRRKLVDDFDYMKYLTWYLHNNPVHHNIFHSLQDYSYSSYQSLICPKPTKLKRNEVVDWYGGVAALIAYHKEQTLNYTGNEIKFWME